MVEQRTISIDSRRSLPAVITFACNGEQIVVSGDQVQR